MCPHKCTALHPNDCRPPSAVTCAPSHSHSNVCYISGIRFGGQLADSTGTGCTHKHGVRKTRVLCLLLGCISSSGSIALHSELCYQDSGIEYYKELFAVWSSMRFLSWICVTISMYSRNEIYSLNALEVVNHTAIFSLIIWPCAHSFSSVFMRV